MISIVALYYDSNVLDCHKQAYIKQANQPMFSVNRWKMSVNEEAEMSEIL